MALDSRDKRASCLAAGLDFRAVRPDPDGSISVGDRQQVTWLYSGLLMASAGGRRLRLLGVG